MGISLPGPAAARRRAAQRTRHQVTGGVLAGVAAVALGVVAVSPPEFVASPEPAETGTDTSTPTTVPTTPTESPSTPPVDPSPDPTSEESPDAGAGQNGDDGDRTGDVVIPPEALMLPEDFRNSDAWTAVSEPNEPILCVPESPAPDARASARADFTGREFDTATQFIEVAPAGTGTDRLHQLRSQAQACVEAASDADTRLVYVWSVGGAGDETWVMSYITPTTLQEESVLNVIVGLSRQDDVVSMVAEAQVTTEFYGIGDWESAVGAIGRICTVMFGESCTDDPQVERLYPEPAGDVDGWLTIDDLAEAGLGALSDGSQVLGNGDDGGPVNYGYVAFTRDPFADGAESLAQRHYNDPLELGGPNLTQERATFPDAEGARAHYAELMAAADQFTQPGDVVENTGTISAAGYEAATWRAENAEFGTVFVYGAAVSGNVVTVVYYGVDRVDVPPDQMQRLLERAAQRIGG
ncbi:hypothetical protein E1262_22955 [Jiangella aurantiaca]|uniref:Uncharacterized protein n=1 Tax=Jiangella aurantiaca TaxID=2530373 RepID=A0A4R5A2S7_9ACTN|nr:hypothetical protein [Jiangella aurantiaca]TDD66218.1 hypothetical protein E1262_22955 [Jiangella aurantiaca]